MADATVTQKVTGDGRVVNVITPAVPQADKVFLTADQIYDADDIATDDYYVERWGGWVKIKQMTLQDEYDLRRQATVGGELDEPLLDALLVSFSLIEPKMDVSRARELLGKNRGAMNGLLAHINSLNKRSAEGLKQLEATFLEAARQGLDVPVGEEPEPDGPGVAPVDDGPGV